MLFFYLVYNLSMKFLIKLFGGYTKTEMNEQVQVKLELAKQEILNESTNKIDSLKDEISELKVELASNKQQVLGKDEMISNLNKQIKEKTSLVNLKESQIEKFNSTIKEIREEKSNTIRDLTEKLTSEKERAVADARVEEQKVLKDSGYIGDLKEDELTDLLSKTFKSDRFNKIGKKETKGRGDIIQEIVDSQGNEVGMITYEIKNRKTWNWAEYDKFVEKIRKVTDNPSLVNVFVTKDGVFPSMNEGSTNAKYKGIDVVASGIIYHDIENNIYLIGMSSVVMFSHLLRERIVEVNELKKSSGDILSLKDEIYDWFRSGYFYQFANSVSRVYNQTLQTVDSNMKNLTILRGEIESSASEVKMLDTTLNKALEDSKNK